MPSEKGYPLYDEAMTMTWEKHLSWAPKIGWLHGCDFSKQFFVDRCRTSTRRFFGGGMETNHQPFQILNPIKNHQKQQCQVIPADPKAPHPMGESLASILDLYLNFRWNIGFWWTGGLLWRVIPLPETNTLPLKIGVLKSTFLLARPIFGC